MTKLITAFIIVVFLFGAYALFQYWEQVSNEKEAAQKQAASAITRGEQLPGMPSYQMEESFQAAQKTPATFKAWLKTYGASVQDPRKAWIELDYCIVISRENPSEARRIFAEVKARTPQTSPVWPRIQQMARAYE